MPVLGITGGIATGKSTFQKTLLDLFPAAFFDADKAAHELLAGDVEVRAAVVELFGSEIFGEGGWPDRALLRKRVFQRVESRQALESILHPRIRQRWVSLAQSYRCRKEWFVVDIPLLYETSAQDELDAVLVVACSRKTQLDRLRNIRQLDERLIESILAAQLDVRSKVALADHVVWNDSTPACLEWQAQLLARSLPYLYV